MNATMIVSVRPVFGDSMSVPRRATTFVPGGNSISGTGGGRFGDKIADSFTLVSIPGVRVLSSGRTVPAVSVVSVVDSSRTTLFG